MDEQKNIFKKSFLASFEKEEESLEILKNEHETFLSKEFENSEPNSSNLLEIYLINELIKVRTRNDNFESSLSEIQTLFSEDLGLIENQFYYFSDSQIIYEKSFSSSEPFEKTVKNLEESGILNWAAENNEISIVPNLTIESQEFFSKVLIFPSKIDKKNQYFFIASIQNDEIEGKLLVIKNLSLVLNIASLILNEKKVISQNLSTNKYSTTFLNQIYEVSPLLISNKISWYFNYVVQLLSKNIESQLNLALTDPETAEKRILVSIENISIINNLISNTTSYFEQFKNTLKNSIVDMKNIFEEISNDFKLIFEHFDINFKIKNNSKNSNQSCNKILMKLIFSEIILNSIEAMPNGGNLDVLLYENEKNKLNISFADNGIGFNENISEIIFEPFFTTKSSKEHLGIGLFFTKYYLSQINAKISVISEEDKGTTVKLLFNKIAK